MRADQLAEAERLHEVVVRAEFEEEHAVELVAASRQHDDRNLRTLANLPAHVFAVEVGESEVEEDEVERRRCVDGGDTARGVFDDVSETFQAFLQ